MEMGGPLGAGIGAAVGAGVGLGEKLAGVETPENEAKRLVRQIYRISIDTAMAQKIVAVAQQMGGNLYQQASYVNGTPYTFQSSLPVLGGFSTGTYPGAGTPAGMASGGGVNLALNINGQAITPEFVADQSMAAQGARYGRTQQAANMQVPGLMVA
jgi:hypothetical protein